MKSWGIEDLVNRLDKALEEASATVKKEKETNARRKNPKTSRPGTPPDPPPIPEKVDAEVYHEMWIQAFDLAVNRDYTTAIQRLTASLKKIECSAVVQQCSSAAVQQCSSAVVQ